MHDGGRKPGRRKDRGKTIRRRSERHVKSSITSSPKCPPGRRLILAKVGVGRIFNDGMVHVHAFKRERYGRNGTCEIKGVKEKKNTTYNGRGFKESYSAFIAAKNPCGNT